MAIRITTPGWEFFTGEMCGLVFEDGVSHSEPSPHQVARLAASLHITDDETNSQMGVSEALRAMNDVPAVIEAPMPTLDQVMTTAEIEKRRLEQMERDKKEQEAASLATAREKAVVKAEDIIIYTRDELEAIAANDGIGPLREIAEPLGVRGRSITDIVDAILEAQAKVA